ncbi:MAG: hypothetical protein EU533_04195 [Promethearchaeota archaeon]|nr:MAG: hypothetical protein EU533_04195 [Candidatus Lokiarchaeota archaeon]
MARSKGYIAAYFAGFIGFVVLLTPVAYHSSSLVESYIWIWGLYIWRPLLGDTSFNFTEDAAFLTWGLIATLIIFFATFLVLSTAHKASKKNRKYAFLWFLCGILFIAAPLVFYFGLSSEFPSWLSDLFWDFYSFHFAFFGSFVAGLFSIIAAFIR